MFVIVYKCDLSLGEPIEPYFQFYNKNTNYKLGSLEKATKWKTRKGAEAHLKNWEASLENFHKLNSWIREGAMKRIDKLVKEGRYKYEPPYTYVISLEEAEKLNFWEDNLC